MTRFSEISETSARRMDRMMLGLADVETFDSLESLFLDIAREFVPADCLCWDTWALDFSRMLKFRITDDYGPVFDNLQSALVETLHHHPVLAAGLLGSTRSDVLRLSDYQSPGRFHENPLFKEVYRHVDAHYQIAYTPCVLSDRYIGLTWNRRAVDFSEKDRQTLFYLGIRLSAICWALDERQMLESSWRSLSQFVDARGAGALKALTASEIELMAELLKSRSRAEVAASRGIRRDSIDRRLGTIRERLGLENHSQLLSAIVDLRSVP